MRRKNKLKVVLYSVLAVLGLGAVGSITYKIVKDNQPIEIIDEIEYKDVKCGAGTYCISRSENNFSFYTSSLKEELEDIMSDYYFKLNKNNYSNEGSLTITSYLYDDNGNSFLFDLEIGSDEFDNRITYDSLNFSKDGVNFSNSLYLPSDDFKIKFDNNFYLATNYSEDDDSYDYYELDINPFTKKRIVEDLFIYFAKYSHFDILDSEFVLTDFSLNSSSDIDSFEYNGSSYSKSFDTNFTLNLDVKSSIIFALPNHAGFSFKMNNVEYSNTNLGSFNLIETLQSESDYISILEVDLNPGKYSFEFGYLAFMYFSN